MPPVIEKIGMIPYLTTPQEMDRIVKEQHELYSRAAREFGFEIK
jgi:hypothetical protein